MQAKAEFPDKLRVLFEPARYKVLFGGRGGAKSWGIARALLVIGAQKPTRILCAREIQKSITESVHQLLADQIKALGLEGFYEVLNTEIRGKNGTLFMFAGLKHNIQNIKSKEGVDVVWCEEAATVSKASWETLIPTIRKEGSEIWVSFNPELDTDETYKRFVLNPPPGAKVVKVNWSDNPWFPDVLAAERDHLKATTRMRISPSGRATARRFWTGPSSPTRSGRPRKPISSPAFPTTVQSRLRPSGTSASGIRRPSGSSSRWATSSA
jgi:phage terminase large subunit